jgi:hypothetical protein
MKNFNPSDLDKFVLAGTVNFGSSYGFPIYGVTTEDIASEEDYKRFSADEDNYNGISYDEFTDIMWHDYLTEYKDDLEDYIDTLNQKLDCWELSLEDGYYDGFYIAFDLSDNWYDKNDDINSDDNELDTKFKEASEIEREKIISTILPEIAKKFELHKYSEGWTQSRIEESKCNSVVSEHYLSDNMIGNIVTSTRQKDYSL